jgi:hypothetical protein
MHKPDSRFLQHTSRLFCFSLIVISLMVMTGCASLFGIKRSVKVPPLLGPLAEANTAELFAEVNRLAAIRSIKGKVDIQVQDNSFAEAGLAEKYRTADGTVYLQRPGQIYLRIQVPFVGTDVAQMTSDGQHFRVAVLQGDEKLRRFVLGTNDAVYPKLAMDEYGKGEKDKKGAKREQTVNVLSSLRPQHFTEALMVLPIKPRDETGLIYSQTEFYLEEPDTRPRAKKDERVTRGYYLLDELAPGGDSGARTLRRFWFDRVGGIHLARVQTFEKDGTLVSDVSYTDPKNFGDGRVVMPGRVELTRPRDRYKLSITYQSPGAVEFDREFPSSVFVLQNKWELPEMNLDEREKQRVTGRQ